MLQWIHIGVDVSSGETKVQCSKPCIGTTGLQAVSKNIVLYGICSQTSSEMETELVLLRLDACSRLLGNIFSHSSFCASSIYFFGRQGPKFKSFEHIRHSEILLLQETKFLKFFKGFFCLRMRAWAGIWAKNSVKCAALLVADCSL